MHITYFLTMPGRTDPAESARDNDSGFFSTRRLEASVRYPSNPTELAYYAMFQPLPELARRLRRDIPLAGLALPGSCGRSIARKVVGCSMKPTLSRELAIDALLMAVWRRKPKKPVLVHSDQGSQYGSDDWLRFCKANNLEPSMSRRGNCWDNAVAESSFSSLKHAARRRSHNSGERAVAESQLGIDCSASPDAPHSSSSCLCVRSAQALLRTLRMAGDKRGKKAATLTCP